MGRQIFLGCVSQKAGKKFVPLQAAKTWGENNFFICWQIFHTPGDLHSNFLLDAEFFVKEILSKIIYRKLKKIYRGFFFLTRKKMKDATHSEKVILHEKFKRLRNKVNSELKKDTIRNNNERIDKANDENEVWKIVKEIIFYSHE